MRIRRIKNCLGLCAVIGCKNYFGVKVSFDERQKETGKVKHVRKFRICHDCAFEMIKEMDKNNLIKWED